MAFWGVELKPDKPYTHPSSKTSGRLRLSQATLGFGSSSKKSLVQCNVGSKSPVLLCGLLPEKSEYCHLELEFDEDDEVVFSVIGPRSVHLSGYYVTTSQRHRGNFDDSSESYGEDIEHSDNVKADISTDEDDYEDSFINDGDVEVSPLSPGFASDEMEDDMMDDKKCNKKKGGRRCRRLRKCQINESEDDGKEVLESEDDDKILISSFIGCGGTTEEQKLAKDIVGDHTENHSDVKADGNNGGVDADPKRDHDVQHTSVPSAAVEGLPQNEEELNTLHSDSIDDNHKDEVPVDATIGMLQEPPNEREPDAQHTSGPSAAMEDLPRNEEELKTLHSDCIEDNHKDEVPVDATTGMLQEPPIEREPDAQHTSAPSAAMQDLPRNEEELKTFHSDFIEDNHKDEVLVDAPTGMLQEPSNERESDAQHTSGPSAAMEDLPRNEEELKTLHSDSIDDNHKDKVLVDAPTGMLQEPSNERELDAQHTSVPSATMEDLPRNEEKPKAGNKMSKKRERKGNTLHSNSIDDNHKDKVPVDATTRILQEPRNEGKSVVCAMQSDEKKSEKKKRKVKGNEDVAMPTKESAMTVETKQPDAYALQSDEKKSKKKKRKVKRNLDVACMEKQAIPTKESTMTVETKQPDGLVVEDLEMGKPDGEVASSGRKVKIHYTSMLKEGGNVYESSIGSKPMKFRLGKGKLIAGVELGLEGMHVGGRRRLTIPPELGYGKEGFMNSVPPNSWLTIDVELLNVR